MLQSPHEALHHLSLVLLTLKLTGYKMCSTHSPLSLHSAAALHQWFVLLPASLACAVTAVAENPAQINGGNINTEEAEAKIFILKRSIDGGKIKL